MKRILKGGTLVGGSGSIVADVMIDGEKIQAVGQNLSADGAEIVDVSGKILFPGFIDAHTHFDLDVCNTTTADDFYTGSRSALRGGTTTIVDFACPNKGESLQYGLDLWHKKAAGKSACDYGFHMTIDDWNEEIRAELPDMIKAGITSFKMYMTYPAMMIGDGDMYRAMLELKKLGAITGVHCENSGIIDALTAERKAAGEMGPSSHPLARPAQLEAEAISHLLRMAELAQAPVIIVHLSTAEGLKEVAAARERGQTVYVETCPHYLLLDEALYANPEYSAAARYVCAPPLRGAADRAALVGALKKGDVQTIATDHCSFTLAQKDAGIGDFTKIPGGLPGVETRGVLIYSELVASKTLTQEQMVQMLCENPAKLYGMWPRKGVLAPGSDADIVVFDPDSHDVIRAEDLIANVDYTPYEGYRTTGRIDAVYLRGSLAVEKGKVLAGSDGTYIHRGKPML